MKPTAPVSTAYTPSATWCPGPCWPTRPRPKAPRPWNAWPAGPAKSITTPSRRWSTPGPKWPAWALPKSRSRRQRRFPTAWAAFPFPVRAGPLHGRDRRLRQAHLPRQDRPHPGRPHHRPPGGGHDCRVRAGAGVRRQQRGHLARTIHGHPTFSEALQEAAMNVQKMLHLRLLRASFKTLHFGQYRRWTHISILDVALLRLRLK
jgi:hypothetical protein